MFWFSSWCCHYLSGISAFPSPGLSSLICEMHHYSSFFYSTRPLSECSRALPPQHSDPGSGTGPCSHPSAPGNRERQKQGNTKHYYIPDTKFHIHTFSFANKQDYCRVWWAYKNTIVIWQKVKKRVPLCIERSGKASLRRWHLSWDLTDRNQPCEEMGKGVPGRRNSTQKVKNKLGTLEGKKSSCRG